MTHVGIAVSTVACTAGIGIARCQDFMTEQEGAIEAAEVEERLPKVPFARRGIVLPGAQDIEAGKEIDKFRQDRRLENDRKRQQEPSGGHGQRPLNKT